MDVYICDILTNQHSSKISILLETLFNRNTIVSYLKWSTISPDLRHLRIFRKVIDYEALDHILFAPNQLFV